jgi:DNA replication protein DnaC
VRNELGAESKCKHCHGDAFVVVRDGGRAVAPWCECVAQPCGVCQGTGFVTTGESRASAVRKCVCQGALARMNRFNDAGIPARHSGSTRLSFKPSNRAQSAVLARVSAWLRDFEPGQSCRGLVLHGDVGRGKTHLMVALLREVILNKGASGSFVEFSHLLADIKSGFDAGHGQSRLLDPLAGVQLLAFDELGKGRNTSFEESVLDELISRRYNADLPIVATTNYAPGPSTGLKVGNAADIDVNGRVRHRPALVDRVGVRVYSRLREMCDFIGVTGEDYRERKPDRG